MNEANVSKTVSIVQVLSALAMSGLIVRTLGVSLHSPEKSNLDILLRFGPTSFMVILSIFPLFVLRIKHRSQAVEGVYIPLYLFFVTLSASSIIPSIETYVGSYIVPYVLLQRLSRFFFLGSSISLFFASLMNYDGGKTLQKNGLYTIACLLAAFIISWFIPANSNLGAANQHEFELVLFILVIILMGILTYGVTFLKDKESYTLKRCLTFFFLGLGHFIILVGKAPVTLLGALMYFIGIIMLCVVSSTGY